MLTPEPRLSPAIESVTRVDDTLVLRSAAGLLRLAPCGPRTVRVTFTQRDTFRTEPSPGVVGNQPHAAWTWDDDGDVIRLRTAEMTVEVTRATASATYRAADGRLLLEERATNARVLDPFMAQRVVRDDALDVEEIETPDGVKRSVRAATRVPDKELYRTWLHLRWQDDEALYGLGQHEEGVLNLRGTRVHLHQANLKIPMPVLVSSRGYGILVDTYSPLVFADDTFGSSLFSEASHELDYYVINGGSLDGVVAGYRELTGAAAMLPRWAYGYLQSQERYETQDEVLAVADGFRQRGFGLDCLVLDWLTWPEGLWGQKTMDPARFPDPAAMTSALHDEHVRLMISVWPNADERSPNYRQFVDHGLAIPGTTLYDAFDERARALYWKQVSEQLFPAGIDAWWCDSSEPITPEWGRQVRLDPASEHREFVDEASAFFDTALLNAYPLFHAMTIHDGQRGATTERRVCNLTRAAWTGQQRLGTILWSGDTSASWETLRHQVAAGLGLAVAGLPYWTTDIGAFFVKQGRPWFWDGRFEDGNADPAYRELYVRWFQFGAFSPVFRSHGTDTRREPWLFGGDDSPTYAALLAANRLRYALLPYLYTQAFRVWRDGASIQRLLAFDFPDDARSRDCADQFLFGESLLVCPVLEPMGAGGGVREVYLPPHDGGWYDLHTGEHHDGGQTIAVPLDLARIPVFAKAGSIVPLVDPAPSTDELDLTVVRVRVFPGRDAVVDLYDDAGDGYGYETGEHALTRLTWSESTGELTVGEPVGRYASALAGRRFVVDVVGR